jgi:hypothetical protein
MPSACSGVSRAGFGISRASSEIANALVAWSLRTISPAAGPNGQETVYVSPG